MPFVLQHVISRDENAVRQSHQRSFVTSARGDTIYLTDDGVILFDSKNERMYDDIVSRRPRQLDGYGESPR